jgi:5-methylcytosine-specific restriction enzyme subunit McrC
MSGATTLLELTEHEGEYFTADRLTQAQGSLLFERFGEYLTVEFPTPPTGNRWRITPKGWIGAFPLDATTTFVALPKLPIQNLAQMLALVYELPVASFPELVSCSALPDLYDKLAQFLAASAHHLLRSGPHQSYRAVSHDLQVVRGRLETNRLFTRPISSRLPCRFDERSGDTLENQAILWTLERILRSDFCSADTRARCRDVFRRFLNVTSSRRVDPKELRALKYTRLTERYRTAHALCLLFLENNAPVAETGDVQTVPFLLQMPRLFEEFVAKWLGQELRKEGTGLSVRRHETNSVGIDTNVNFIIDLVIYDDATGRPVCVLDTKYKNVVAPASDDVQQIGFYALLKGCDLGGLVYPVAVSEEWEGMSGTVSTFRSSFTLADNLNVAGARFFADLIGRLGTLSRGREGHHHR